MKKLIGLVLLFSLFGCSSHAGYQSISADESLHKISEGAKLLDVREPDEYAQGHIPNSKNIPLQTIGEGIKAITNNKEQVIIVYCRSGNRSKQAAEELLKQGYNNVYDLGGINTWPYEIEK